VEELEAGLQCLRLPLVRLPRGASFLAGQATRRYRFQGGIRENVLADFFVGAHAALEGATLLTRDRRRVQSYFPTVTIISP
jgi:predicted nucleic acid-binding protein